MSNKTDDKSLGAFFDQLSGSYAAAIERCVPRYREMLWALLDYLPPGFAPRSVLELGAGTGNLSVVVANAFPEARLRLVDLSAESLAVCRQRLPTDERFFFEQQDFRQLKYEPDTFDLIVSSISLHHLTSLEKQILFRHANNWLGERGILTYCDQFAGVTEDLYQRHLDHWRRQARAAGASDDEWQMWMDHQTQHDHHDSLPDQLDWLRDAGFSDVDCTWRHLLWTVLQARK